MRLYFYHNRDTYFLNDYAHNEKLIQSGTPIRRYGRKHTPCLDEDDVLAFQDIEFPSINMSFDFEI